jgi:Flp pilus assembly protein TadD
MIVTLPFVLLLLDVWPLGRWVPPHFRRGTAPGTPQASVGGLVLEKLPLFALAAASAVVTYLAQTQGGTVGSLEVYPLSVRVGNALVSYAVYLRQTLWPHGLAAIYPHPRALPPLWQLLGAAALLGGISLAAARGARRVPAVAVGWLWYLGTLVPVIGLVQAGAQAHADRYTYLPLVGIFVALAWGAAPLRERFCPPRAAAALAALTLVTLALVTRSQIGTWRDTRTLLEHAIAAVEDNWVAHMTLAIDLEKRGDFAGAEEHVREMARIKRDMPKDHLPAWLRTVPPADGEAGEELPGERGLDAAGRAAWRQGVGLLREGRFREAAEQFAAVLRLQPGHAGAHNNLGMALAGVGELDAAAERFREASRLGPAEPEPLVNLGNVLLLQGDRAGAIASYRRALALQPDSAPAHANLGDALLTAGRRYAALFEYREALRLAPDHVRARRKLAEARAGAGDPRVAGPGSSGDSLDYLLLP